MGSHLKIYINSGELQEPVNCNTLEVSQRGTQMAQRTGQRAGAEDSGALFIDTLHYNLGIMCNDNEPQPNEEQIHRYVAATDSYDSHLNSNGQRRFLADPIYLALRQAGWL